MNPGLNQLLKWSIENTSAESAPPADSTTLTTQTASQRSLDASALASLLGGPSDADLMRASVTTLSDASETLPNRLIAADNLEQLIESLDNANLLAPLGLWTPLFGFLDDVEAEIRILAAWCVGTAVQNNLPAQEAAMEAVVDGKKGGGMAKLVRVAVGDVDGKVRAKAVRGVSSWVRNFQKGVDALLGVWSEEMGGEEIVGKVDAGDMEQVDGLMERLKSKGAERGRGL